MSERGPSPAAAAMQGAILGVEEDLAQATEEPFRTFLCLLLRREFMAPCEMVSSRSMASSIWSWLQATNK